MRRSLALVALLVFAASATAQMPAQPGEHHKALAQLAGDWSGTTTFQLPGMEPMVSDVKMTATMEMNGLWLISKFSGSMMGMPFSGMSIQGYDSAKGKVVERWIDSFRDTISEIEGDYDAATTTWTKWTEGKNPMDGSTVQERHTIALGEDGSYRLELASEGPGGDFMPYMVVEMTKSE